MTLHLLRHELRRHRLLYPLAALLIFAAQFLPHLGDEGTASTLVIVVGFIGVVIVHLLMGSHPWHDDRAAWRTRPVAARQLLAGQALAIAVVVLLPVAAGLLLRILPLDLGLLPTSLAILLPLGIVLALATALAACAAFAKRSGRADPTPYLVVFIAPLLSAAAFGFVHMFIIRQSRGPTTDGEKLTSFLFIILIAVAAALAALLVGTLRRKRGAGMIIMLVAGIALPWIGAIVSFDLFRQKSPAPRSVRAIITPQVGDQPSRPAWTGLADNEFFAARVVHASWTGEDGHVAWMWPHSQHRSVPVFLNDLLRDNQRAPLQDQHNQFASANDIDALWTGIRARLPDHATWRPGETTTRFYEPLLLGDGPRLKNFWFKADGDVFRLDAIDPVATIAPGRLNAPRPGRVDITRIATGDSRIAILLRHTFPNPILTNDFSPSRHFSTSPPDFWAVLLHEPSSTAYACHGIRTRTRHLGTDGTIIRTRHHTLTFDLPRLETQLLGLDPQQLLAESTLHLFQAVPIARAEAKLDQ